MPDQALSAALEVLGLGAGADRDDVIQAYRRLARVTHPDLSDAPDAAARFDAVTTAYRHALGTARARPAPARPAPAAGSPFVRSAPSGRSVAAAFAGSPYIVLGSPTPVIVVGPVRVEPLSPNRATNATPPYRAESLTRRWFW